MKTIKNNFYFLKNVFDYSRPYVIGEAAVAVIEGFMPLLDIIIPKRIIDSLLFGNSFQEIVFYILIYVILRFFGAFLSACITETCIQINAHLYAMHFLLMINRKKVALDMAQLDDPRVHQQAALAEDLIYKGIGIDIIDDFFTAVTSAVSLFATAAVLIYANPCLLLFLVIFAGIATVLHLKMEQWEFAQREETMYLTRVLNYYIKIMGETSNAKEMRVYGFVEWLIKKYHKTLQVLKKRLKKLYQKGCKIQIADAFVENIKSNGTYLFLAWLAFRKKITIGEFSQYFTAASQFSESFLQFISFFTNLNINGNYIESFRHFMELQPELSKDREGQIGKEKFAVIKNGSLRLSLSHVGFGYQGMDSPILKDISYTFEQGKVYLLAGENGAGKTTLIQLLVRLYQPDCGGIQLNHIPVEKFHDRDYKSLFGVVFQDFQYFAFTIAENIALSNCGREDTAVRERIERALQKAGLKKKIQMLPDGIDTNLDKIFYKDGVVLSGGENQKLAFARALFREAEILILDEPSSALDPVAEHALFEAFQEIAGNKIIIYISHRLSSAVLADEVLFLKDGRIWESGTHKELLKKQGEYAKYYNLQAKYYA